MPRVAIVSTCALNQYAMDITCNLKRIVESVKIAKERGARYRCGPELDITGYGCGDHFMEADTQHYAWQGLAKLLQHEDCNTGILVDVGLPVQHNNVVYNCKLVFFNRKIVLIRPKMMLADDSHMGYQETRWFTPWQKVRQVEEHQLPPCITKVTGQRSVPFGDALVVTRDTTIGYEICEELWNPDSPHVGMSLDGAEIICNGSGSLQELGRPDAAYHMILSATTRSGGCYLFANQKGCDGTLGYYAGDACIAVNGKLVAAAPLHTVQEVEVLTAVVDLDAVLTYRNLIRSRSRVAASPTRLTYPRVQVDFTLCHEEEEEEEEKEQGKKEQTEATNTNTDKAKTGHRNLPISLPIQPTLPTLAEQVLEGAACWLWDYLRRSTYNGLLLCLSGGVTDAATGVIVLNMCHKVMQAAPHHPQVRQDIEKMIRWLPQKPNELCSFLLVTFSSAEQTQPNVIPLAEQIGSIHESPVMQGDTVQQAVRSLQMVAAAGGNGEALTRTIQHLHAFQAHLLAATVSTGKLVRGERLKLLVLATAPAGNTPEAFRDTIRLSSKPRQCNSGFFGDVSVVGHIPKNILQEVLQLAKERFNLPVLEDVLAEESRDMKTTEETTELEKDEEEEKKEEEKNWAEIWTLHRKEHLGPHSMFRTLLQQWKDTYTPTQVAWWVHRFFLAQGAGAITPSSVPTYYVAGAGPQHPSRPWLAKETVIWQFKDIYSEAAKIEEQAREDKEQQQQQ